MWLRERNYDVYCNYDEKKVLILKSCLFVKLQLGFLCKVSEKWCICPQCTVFLFSLVCHVQPQRVGEPFR